MREDLQFAVRMLRKNLSFTVVAVISLALGIGANTAIFQLVNVLRLKSLPVRAPQEIAEIRISDMAGARGSFSARYHSVTNPVWEQIRDRQQNFSGVLAWGNGGFNLAQGGEVRIAKSLWVSGDFFNVLGVQPALGRLFTAADDTRGCTNAGVVISNAFWQREYGGQKDVIGKKLTLVNQPFEIIGVTPESFFGLEVGRTFDLALPICAEALTAGKNNRLDSGTDWWLMVMGRLKPGSTLPEASANLNQMSQSIFETTLPKNYPPVSVPKYLKFKLEALPAGEGISSLREIYQRPLWILLAIAGAILLIACANLANLLLARASMREREMAVRLAVGANRLRLIRQLLVENLLLAVVGAVFGVLLAQSLSRFLVSFISTADDQVFLDLGLDWRVLGFTAAVAALTCILFGLTPALRATRVAPRAAMDSGGRGNSVGREGFSLRRGLVVVQVALSLVLVSGAVLFSRSLNKLMNVDTGFRPEGVLVTGAGFGRLNLEPERRVELANEMLQRIQAIPGVEAAAQTSIVPLSGSSWGNGIWLNGGDPEQKLPTAINRVGPNYFNTLKLQLLAGRDFDGRDTSNSPRVAIVSESVARKLVNGANPVGLSFKIEATPGEPETLYQIVGYVKDAKYEDLREDPQPTIYLAQSQAPEPASYAQFLIRSRLQQQELTNAVKQVIGNVNPRINIQFWNYKTIIEETVLRDRLMAALSGLFGVLALVLAAVGLYGILSYGVASRTKEIGIRMALGSQTSRVLVLVLREGMLLVVIGLVVGVPAVIGVTRFAASLLFGLTPTDPISLIAASMLMVVVALVASYLPARRATKVDPLVALRYE
jgi:putative ABC transport system permease protein